MGKDQDSAHPASLSRGTPIAATKWRHHVGQAAKWRHHVGQAAKRRHTNVPLCRRVAAGLAFRLYRGLTPTATIDRRFAAENEFVRFRMSPQLAT